VKQTRDRQNDCHRATGRCVGIRAAEGVSDG
jgi:hypothetical protein